MRCCGGVIIIMYLYFFHCYYYCCCCYYCYCHCSFCHPHVEQYTPEKIISGEHCFHLKLNFLFHNHWGDNITGRFESSSHLKGNKVPNHIQKWHFFSAMTDGSPLYFRTWYSRPITRLAKKNQTQSNVLCESLMLPQGVIKKQTFIAWSLQSYSGKDHDQMKKAELKLKTNWCYFRCGRSTTDDITSNTRENLGCAGRLDLKPYQHLMRLKFL